jgi:hypothetical protein
MVRGSGRAPRIERQDLPGQRGQGNSEIPDFGSCLQERADKAAERAAARFNAIAQTSAPAGQAALRASFRALARRLDQGTWARRFADPADIQTFLMADPLFKAAKSDEKTRWEALQQALNVFILRGYLSGALGRPYDISHEALIPNWPKFREWLQGPDKLRHR